MGVAARSPWPRGRNVYDRPRFRQDLTVPEISAGAVPSPNIWNHPATYELENHAIDPEGVIDATTRSVRPYDDSVLLDIGCGTGYHLPAFAAHASRVIGVEPHPVLVLAARRRTAGLANVEILQGTAQSLPVASASIDVVQARWAYFFGPGCEPGLLEIDRVLRRGGAAFLVDNDATRSTFGRWFSWEHPGYDTESVERFFSRHGWTSTPQTMRWSFATRRDFEAVVRIEFSHDVAERVCAEHRGTEVDYAVVIRHRSR